MKNRNIKVGEVVPVEIRIEVYKKAIKIIEIGKICFGLTSPSLCLMLPCILWDLKHFLNDAHNGEMYCCDSAKAMFPELTDDVITHIEGNHRLTNKSYWSKSQPKNKVRLYYLKKFINKLTN